MGTIVFQVTEGGQPNVSKTFNFTDAQIDRLVVAYQGPANVAINGTASRAQVLNYIVTNVWVQGAISFVQSFETTPPVVPSPIVPT